MEISEIIRETFTLGTPIGLNTTHNASLYASVSSSCAQTPPPPSRLLRGIFPPFQSRGGAFANFVLPGGRAFANPGAIPELLSRTRFPIRI